MTTEQKESILAYLSTTKKEWEYEFDAAHSKYLFGQIRAIEWMLAVLKEN